MVDELTTTPYRTAALDRSHSPRSFMSAEQAMLVDWLLEQAELIPVTARGTEEFSRVCIPFNSWAITTHGAVILNEKGHPNPEWEAQILGQIQPYTETLHSMHHAITALMKARNINAWARINYEYNHTPIYLIMKHCDSTRLSELYKIADEIEEMFSTEGFYIHRNGNNIAWLPQPVKKEYAARWLLEKLRSERGPFPVIGLGDSLSDYGFMQLCSWYGVPNQSQFSQHIHTLNALKK